VSVAGQQAIARVRETARAHPLLVELLAALLAAGVVLSLAPGLAIIGLGLLALLSAAAGRRLWRRLARRGPRGRPHSRRRPTRTIPQRRLDTARRPTTARASGSRPSRVA